MTTPGLLYMDGFSHYGALTTNMLADPAYLQVDTGFAIGTPAWDTTGELALSCQTSTNPQLCRRQLAATKTALLTSFRFGLTAMMDTDGYVDIYDWRDGSNTVICKLSVNKDGSLALKLADNTVLGTSAASLQHIQLWQFYEMELDCVAKTFELHLDDVNGTDTPILDLSGLSIGDGPIDSYGLLPLPGGSTLTPTVYLRDLIVRDPAGSVNNGFQGEYAVATDFVDADVDVNWVPFYNGGPELGAYTTIDKSTPLDTTYIESDDTVPKISDFTVTNPTGETTLIAGAMIIQRSFTDDGNLAQSQVSMVGPRDGVISGDYHMIDSSTPSYFLDIFEYDPDITGPITPATIINGKVRISRTI